jgi:hypothetical protein
MLLNSTNACFLILDQLSVSDILTLMP